jgi:hypothetical protein
MWKKSGGDVPELWRLSLGPSTVSFQCLGVQESLADCNVAMNVCVGIGNLCVLFGSEEDVNDDCFLCRFEYPGILRFGCRNNMYVLVSHDPTIPTSIHFVILFQETYSRILHSKGSESTVLRSCAT